jgi:hypothetical protein
MILIPPPDPSRRIKYVTVFAADVMFFQSATTALEQANVAKKGITLAERRLSRHKDKMDVISRLAQEEGWNDGLYSRFEPLAIR